MATVATNVSLFCAKWLGNAWIGEDMRLTYIPVCIYCLHTCRGQIAKQNWCCLLSRNERRLFLKTLHSNTLLRVFLLPKIYWVCFEKWENHFIENKYLFDRYKHSTITDHRTGREVFCRANSSTLTCDLYQTFGNRPLGCIISRAQLFSIVHSYEFSAIFV